MSTMTILDHIDGTQVEGDPFKKPANEYWALVCLRQGLEYLNRQAHQCNELARNQLNPHGDLRVMSFGNDPSLVEIPKGLLTCAFHWYAISACQYVRTVGAIACRQATNPSPRYVQEYVERVIPEVLAYRDKVAAHFSWTTKHKEDNEAERALSVMPHLTFQDTAFYIAGWSVTIRSKGEVSDSKIIKPWSITGVHEQLRKRYWLQQKT